MAKVTVKFLNQDEVSGLITANVGGQESLRLFRQCHTGDLLSESSSALLETPLSMSYAPGQIALWVAQMAHDWRLGLYLTSLDVPAGLFKPKTPPLCGNPKTSCFITPKLMILGNKQTALVLEVLVARAGLNKDKIIAAAGRLADDEGFESLTLAAVARIFDVRLPSLYGHVANLHELKKGVGLLALDSLAERTEEAIAGRAGKDALVALVNTHRDFARQHPGLFQASRYPLDAQSAALSGGARLARVNHAMLRGYSLRDEDRVHATRLIGSFVLGFSLLELAGSFSHSDPEPELSWKRDVEGLDGLLQSWAGQRNIAESI